jgi:ligand-binding sensor domain-containing protein
MKNGQKKIGKVMREFKKGELNIGKSSKKVKSPKQAIAIALSEAGQSRKPMAKGGSVNGTSRSEYGNLVDPSQFLNSDGYAQAVDVEVSNPQETQLEQVGGQRRMLPDKKRKAKWY